MSDPVTRSNASRGRLADVRVLAAEDDPGLHEVLVLGLEDQGYQVDARPTSP